MKYFLIIGKTPELTYAELDAYQIMFSPHKHNILIIETAE